MEQLMNIILESGNSNHIVESKNKTNKKPLGMY